MSYNVQNLFDEIVDGTEYPEYRGGSWTLERVDAKCKAVARVIRGSVPGGPDLVALQEVENLRILKRLRDLHLAGMGYHAAILVREEGRATHPAVLSRIPVRRTRLLAVPGPAGPARGILEVELDYQGRALRIFNSHWKSKIGGVRRTEAERLAAAKVVRERLLEILDAEPEADLVVLGDLNENVEEAAPGQGASLTAIMPLERSEGVTPSGCLFLARRPAEACFSEGRLVLYEPWYELSGKDRGSYFFEGKWQTPDHILLAAGLFDRQGFRYEQGGFRVMRSAFMVEPRRGRPRGISDHLPLLLDLKLAPR